MKITDAKFSNSVNSVVADVDQLKIPEGAEWISNDQIKRHAHLSWDDGHWNLDFKSADAK